MLTLRWSSVDESGPFGFLDGETPAERHARLERWGVAGFPIRATANGEVIDTDDTTGTVTVAHPPWGLARVHHLERITVVVGDFVTHGTILGYTRPLNRKPSTLRPLD